MQQGYVLVVDDNVGIRRLLYELLTQEGYNVETAENGMECLIKVQVNKLDLIILDAKMPGISGIETVNMLKKSNPDLPIIMISAYSEMPLISEALENGSIKYYLTKPFDLDKVRNLVKVLVKKGTRLDYENCSEQ
ncbi:MAG: response regulator [Desulfitobacteriaceae bacterium]